MTAAVLVSMNAGWFVIGIFIIVIFGRYLLLERRRGWQRNRVKAASALFVYFIGETGWHGMWWGMQSGVMADISSPLILIMLLATGAIAAVGALCCIRVFSPDGEGSEVVAVALLLAFAAVAFALYL